MDGRPGGGREATAITVDGRRRDRRDRGSSFSASTGGTRQGRWMTTSPLCAGRRMRRDHADQRPSRRRFNGRRAAGLTGSATRAPAGGGAFGQCGARPTACGEVTGLDRARPGWWTARDHADNRAVPGASQTKKHRPPPPGPGPVRGEKRGLVIAAPGAGGRFGREISATERGEGGVAPNTELLEPVRTRYVQARARSPRPISIHTWRGRPTLLDRTTAEKPKGTKAWQRLIRRAGA